MSARGSSGMEHGASVESRTKAFRSFGTRFGGHLVVMNLLKRWDLLSRRVMPLSIEEGWSDRYAVLWDRLARKALGYRRVQVEATPIELWRMAKSLVAAIDDLPARCDDYPDGWAAMADMIRADRRVPLEQAPQGERDHSAEDANSAARNALHYVASEMGIDTGDVMRAMGLTKPLKQGAGVAIMEWYEEQKRGTDNESK